MKTPSLIAITLLGAIAQARISEVINNQHIVFEIVTYHSGQEEAMADAQQKCDRIVKAINLAAKNSAHSTSFEVVTGEVKSFQCVITNPFQFKSVN